ncbi:helix-turn-helix domain-containing protein, partial [Escherichia coli]|uniref:helix-turn-helix domain-containing protein n=1 Tax=Escherichia coli TaxID=562 RepID=UPI001BE47580
CYVVVMDDVATRLGRNMRTLREGRSLTQAQMAKMASLPRATWANLESGAANPTLAVLDRVANAFQVTIEELISAPRSEA